MIDQVKKNIIVTIFVIVVVFVVGIFFRRLSFFESNNTPLQSFLTEAEARKIAEKECIKGGEAVVEERYEEQKNGWVFDANLNSSKVGCIATCVVYAESKQTELEWQCD